MPVGRWAARHGDQVSGLQAREGTAPILLHFVVQDCFQSSLITISRDVRDRAGFAFMVGLMRAYALSCGRLSCARYPAKEKGQMVPPDYAGYFMTMAAVGATLFGLIFVVISIAPASIATASAPLERQVKALT